VVELEQDQVAALQQARTNIATDRNVRLGIAQDCHIDKEHIKIAIKAVCKSACGGDSQKTGLLEACQGTSRGIPGIGDASKYPQRFGW
jgi:hypothetical protein